MTDKVSAVLKLNKRTTIKQVTCTQTATYRYKIEQKPTTFLLNLSRNRELHDYLRFSTVAAKRHLILRSEEVTHIIIQLVFIHCRNSDFLIG